MDLATGGENRPMWPGHIGMPNPGVESVEPGTRPVGPQPSRNYEAARHQRNVTA